MAAQTRIIKPLNAEETSATADEALFTSQLIGAVYLSGKHPSFVGAVLADLTARYLAGHESGVREALLEAHIVGVRSLMPIKARKLWNEDGTPK